MHFLFFSVSHYFFIKISSDQPLIFGDSESLLLKGYIPSLERLHSEPTRIDLVIEHHESEEKKLIQEDGRVKIFDTWKGVFSADVYHVLYGIVRVQFLKRNLFPIHGACVGKDDGYVLMVGHSGAGKTSVILKLLQDPDIKIFSGNKTVVSFGANAALVGVAGTPTITIRGSDKSKWDDEKIIEYVAYWERLAFTLSPARYPKADSVPIKAVVVVRLNDYTEECKKLSPSSALHTLYSYFLDVVNADVVLSDAEDVFIGTPPPGTEKYLVSHLKTVLTKIPAYSLIGSSSFVANEILRL